MPYGTARGEVRSQFHHVIDIAPTVLEAAGLPHPTMVDGVEQHPIEGVSMRYSFDNAEEADRHTTQYFEMFCNRGIYHEGWTAVTRHSTPWVVTTELPALEDDVWELYDTTTDWSQRHDLAAEMPEKLAETLGAQGALRLGDRGKREVTIFELGAEPGALDEHHAEQEPMPGRKPSQAVMAKRAAAVVRKRQLREQRAARSRSR